jgi:hypothetical protein
VREAQTGDKIPVNALSQSLILRATGGPRQPAAAIVSRSLFGEFDASDASSALGTVNCEKPQSKQTKSFGNSMTPELSRFMIPPRWTSISAENST